MGTTKKYWKGLEDLNNDPQFIKAATNEFAEPIPAEQFLGNSALENSSTKRRDFLKFLGFSVTAASLAACEAPVRKVIPYVIKPEEVTPGVANFYASTYADGNDYCSILVKTREGRPIKIEGNALSSLSSGGTNARVQASILSLYDNGRIGSPLKAGNPSDWSTLDKEIGAKLEAIVAKNGNIRILTSTLLSPSTKQIIADFTAKYPTAKHVTYDPISYSALINANQYSFDKPVLASYNFTNANVIVSFAADFLANWVSPIEHSKQYGKNRKLGKEKKTMSKHYQFESNLSLTGSNADVRGAIKPSQQGAAVVNLYNEIAKLAGAAAVSSKATEADKKIAAAAKDLWENKGKSLVVSGINDTNIQIVVNAINSLLGNYGSTVDIDTNSNLKQGIDSEVVALAADMNAGKVDAVFIHGCNPVYSMPASLSFESALKKVSLKVSFADRNDETASLCDYVAPDHHYLEAWGDASPKKGIYSLQQPTIQPLFDTRQFQDTLLKWSGAALDYYTYLVNYWEKNVFPMQSQEATYQGFWNKALQDGVFEATPTAASTLATVKDISTAASEATKKTGGKWELAIYEKTGLGNGNQANNPWLQEMPDPISKVTWDNYITMNPVQMKEMGLCMNSDQLENKYDMLTVTANGVTLELPVYPSPGQKTGTIGIALGYGRTKAGKAGSNVGKNAFPALSVVNGTIEYHVYDVKVSEKSENGMVLAATQTHHTMMGREIVKETTLAEWLKNPAAGNKDELIQVKDGHKTVGKKPEEVDLWTDTQGNTHDRPGHWWGMSIDLNSCIGCGACVVACQSENNVPVVGKDEVRRGREMHWIRIDRYYSSDVANLEEGSEEGKGIIQTYREMEVPSEQPQVVFQPIMCQHCNHAPCETVCPVLATTHSSEGLNQMTYNRCVGTRYCANNCPYKVRRFNWFKYSDNAQFDYNMNDDLGKMVLNPDVVVRSRGVIEKCSMCVQRIQDGKLTAKKESRKLVDGEIKTACASACPTNAIVFGDMNNPESEVSKLKKEERMYHLLRELNVQPSSFYLTKVRNTEAEMSEAKAEKKEA